MNQQDILRTVLAEHDGEQATGSTLEALTADVEARLAGTAEVSRPGLNYGTGRVLEL